MGVQLGVVQPIFFAFVLILQSLGVLLIAPDYTKIVSVWTALNVFSLVGIVRAGLLFGRGAATRKCIHCDSKKVVPATYLCLDCESTIGPPKELRDKMGKN